MANPAGLAAETATSAGALPTPASALGSVAAAGSKASRSPSSKLTQALEDLKRTLTKDQKASFEKCDVKDVEAAIHSIQAALGAQRRVPNLARLDKFVKMVGQLAVDIGDFASVNGSSGFLWAPIRHALLQATKGGAGAGKGHYLDNLVDILAQIGDIFPHLNEYQELFSRYPDVVAILDDYREAILKFHTGLMEVFNRSAWRTMFDSSWSRFSKLAEETKLTLRRNRKLLDEAKDTAAMREIQAVRDQVDQLGRSAALRDDQALRERRLRQQQEVVRKLTPPQYGDDQSDIQRRMHESARVEWLLGNERFSAWADLGDEEHKILDLNGCPGAGKTFLASSVIRHLDEMKARTTKRISLAYFFFKHDNDNKKTFKSALQAILEQFVTQDDDDTLLDHAFRLLATVYTPSRDQLEKLASTAIRSKRICFLIIDGIDECIAEDQLSLLRWLKELTKKSDDPAFTLRTLLSARREGHLEREISSFPSVETVRVDACRTHELCIRNYVEKEAKAIQESFRACPETGKKIVDKIMSKVQGMFLFAHVVLQCLWDLPTIEELVEELQDNVFPSEVNKAYDRVAARVFDTRSIQPSSRKARISRQDLAKRVLSWASCASRPLYWREIQARFTIDPLVGPQPDAHRRTTRFSPKELCGCFIDVTGTGSDSNKAVHIVHRTAAEYLERTSRIPSPIEQHLEMLSFCCQYLNSTPFTKLLSTQVRQVHAETGYYAFQDYASAHWWDHANALASDPELLQHRGAMQTASAELSQMLASYDKGSEESKNGRTSGQLQDFNLITILAKLDPSASERNKPFLFEYRISLTREAILAMETDTSSRDKAFLDLMQTLYGPWHPKCPKPWCIRFHMGFEEHMELQDHMNTHDRPFKCSLADCPASRVGFETGGALNKHHRRYHQVENKSLFPDIVCPSASSFDLLCQVVQQGSLERIKALLSSATIREALNNGAAKSLTPLIWAIRRGDLQICKVLLDAGATVNRQSRTTPITPLREAIAANDMDIFQLLLCRDGVDPFEDLSVWPAPERRSKLMYLHVMAHDTLAFALATSSSRFVLPLLSKAALPPDRHRTYFQAICGSRAPGRGEMFRLLRQHLPETNLDYANKPLLSFAAESNNIEVLGLILAAGSSNINQRCHDGRSPLSYAAEEGSITAIREILAVDGAELDTIDNGHRTAYWWAAYGGHLPVLEALLDAQCPGVDLPDSNGQTPLFIAAVYHRMDCIRWLLGTGSVDASHADKNGKVPTSPYFLKSVWPSPEAKALEVAELLLKAAGTSGNPADCYGWTPLHYCVINKSRALGDDMASLLLNFENSVDVNRKTTSTTPRVEKGITALEMSLKNGGGYTSPSIAKAIVATGRFDFSALDEKRTEALLRGCLEYCGPSFAVEMFQHGFRPRFSDVLNQHTALAAHLLAAMDENLTIDYLKQPECFEIFQLLRTPAAEDAERKAALSARHSGLIQVIRATVGNEDIRLSAFGDFPSISGYVAESGSTQLRLVHNDPMPLMHNDPTLSGADEHQEAETGEFEASLDSEEAAAGDVSVWLDMAGE